MYMVTVNWRGALHIDPMRLIEDLEAARRYASTLNGGTPRIYQLFADKPPKLVK